MRVGRPLPRAFFGRACLQVARQLVGSLVVRRLPDGSRLIGRVVEVEAYLGDGSDPASHSHHGPTARNRSMFGPPGQIYAYRSYGIHTCVNAVCEAEGIGAAVLLRALEPLAGIAGMRRARRLRPDQGDRLIASGPGRLAQALSLDLESDGLSAVHGSLTFHRDESDVSEEGICVKTGPRIGISRAVDLPYRFCLAESGWLSRTQRRSS